MNALNYQLIQYGYSILDYVRKYDNEWIKSVEYLKQILNLNNDNQLSFKRKISSSLSQIKLLKSIPNENIHEIMSYLNAKELIKVSLISKTWYELSNRNDLWNHLLKVNFSITIENVYMKDSSKKRISSKNVYKQLYETFHKLRNNKITKLKSKPIIPSYIL